MDREPVEGFKLSKEQISWMEQFKKYKRIADYLSNVLERGKQIMDGPREALRRVLSGMDALADQAPSDEIRDLYGQPKPTEVEGERSIYDVRD